MNSGYREKGDTITGNGTNYIYLGKKLIAKYGDVTPQTVNESRQHSRPFGESIEAPKDDVGYTGHKFDTDLGLSYMQARYYDPVIGRFYSNDPIGFRDVHSFNRYAYANNNPYKYIDPDGNNPVAIGRFVTPPPIIQFTSSGVGQSTQPAYIISGGINTERTDRFGNLVFNESTESPVSIESDGSGIDIITVDTDQEGSVL
ncbi:RHS repeat-associated core domain-containing protein [Pseudoalteromonas sp. NEC-BIFX-2020_015]|uniref:RHS repeat-associated core domain-containing protein n=1 Tax=Pseudoalteromonas sp. NEC-BIFX-2020_015 TaxID=2729544 RepID=UPI001461656A|nr:RHS repeat-associated core domain-containing protein [Pseudoalteromonas sp. NEC-BIFX-2020_015]NMR27968.1 RHS repeat-associated core domain-containing protein [Pseudoalteromonas sp. NEC-BIFX-2020_015]